MVEWNRQARKTHVTTHERYIVYLEERWMTFSWKQNEASSLNLCTKKKTNNENEATAHQPKEWKKKSTEVRKKLTSKQTTQKQKNTLNISRSSSHVLIEYRRRNIIAVNAKPSSLFSFSSPFVATVQVRMVCLVFYCMLLLLGFFFHNDSVESVFCCNRFWHSTGKNNIIWCLF